MITTRESTTTVGKQKQGASCIAEIVLEVYKKHGNSDKPVDFSGQITAYHRLQYVCGALLLFNELSGQILVEYHGPMFEIPSATCFKLLKRAMKKPSDTDLTFRELWDFVNVLYMNLVQLHDRDSPLNGAMLPDPFVVSEIDTEVKQAMKGEILTFLIHTARDFASSSMDVTSDEDGDPATLSCTGFSRPDLNGIVWVREAFLVAARPCYKPVGRQLYLYFRAGSGKWVIDDEVVPRGAAYAASTTSQMSGAWLTSAEWKIAPHIHVQESGRNYVVSGCRGEPGNTGASSSRLDNGTYVLQPDSEKVNGHPHYVLKSHELQMRGEQRHLIYSPTSLCWKITPTCGEEEGACVIQSRLSMSPYENEWMVIPADVLDSVRFKSMDGTTRHVTANMTVDSSGGADENDSDDEEEDEDATTTGADQICNLVPWNMRNHESLLFSNKTSTLAFFSAHPAKLKNRMNPALVKFLEVNKIVVGEDLHSATTEKYHRLLCALANVPRTNEETSQILNGRFALTGDALLKFLAILTRLRCGIPVVLLGECGCGKTFAIKFLAAFLRVKLIVLDVHGGTTEQDVLDIIRKAEAYITESGGREVMVFLDEINTCAHLGLIEELLVQRSAFGSRIHDKISLLAALNPYREAVKSPEEDIAGLAYRGDSSALLGSSVTHQNHVHHNTPNKKNLVYLVHPVPSPLVHVAFDFGSLRPKEEHFYIASMCSSTFAEAAASGLPNLGPALLSSDLSTATVEWICAAQFYIRQKEADPSAASLRDAQRCLDITVWFLRLAEKRDSARLAPVRAAANCVILGLAFAYMFRLASRSLRTRFWDALRAVSLGGRGFSVALAGFRKDGAFEAVLESTQSAFCKRFQVEPGIALNEALSENLFLSVVCILNRIPLFLVGKPGTSKTLALQIAASNLLGKNSPMPFWRSFPALAMFTYQCSPLSTAVEIRKQFDVACRFQAHASEQISVFVLDEVGLAEFSPHLPLKVLHSILVEPPVAVVGVSNWTLDRAKMNRAILLTRPEPSVADLKYTGERITRSLQQGTANDNDEWWLECVTDTFYRFYTKERENGREFWGMRDYYALIRQLKSVKELDKESFVIALCRNLGGKPDKLNEIVDTFVSSIGVA